MANTLDKIRLSGVTYDIIDSTAIHTMDGYWTSGQTESAITAATGALAETIAEQHYQTSGDVQNAISGKANSSDVVTAVETNNTSESVGINVTSGGTTTRKQLFALGRGLVMADGNNNEVQIDSDNIPTKSWVNSSISGFADAVAYDTSTKYMKFYNGGTGGTMVFQFDASPFLIDGMIESVVITSVTSGASEVEVLQITWNSAAGGQVTNIPLSEIFDPTNYYTKSEVDSALSAKTDNADFTAYTSTTDTVISNKADATAVTAVNNVLTAHTADTTIHVTSSDKTTWSGKQDALVSGTNIKTVGGNSLLGSGDIAFPAGMTAEVSGTTLIFS